MYGNQLRITTPVPSLRLHTILVAERSRSPVVH